ncbi:MAG: phosphatidate cytidylyltransferase [Vulcanococcus sp.]
MIPPPRTRTTPQRLLSGYAAGGFGLLVVGLGGWWFTAALGVMVHLGLLEYFRLAQFKGIRPASKTTLVLVQLLLVTTQWAHGGDAVGVGFAADLASAVLPISGALICGWLLLQPLTGSIADIAASIFALFYLGFLPSYWIRLRDLTDPALAPRLAGWLGHWPGASSGMVLMLMACLLIVATDIGSYVLGRRYGRRPLSPISPGKTLEGALGGLGCAVLLGAGFGVLLGWHGGWAAGGLLGAVVALFALVGDLTESMMKRDAGVKDSRDLLPGHGGILDRIDSYLFTPAAFYTVVTLLAPLIR